MAEAGVPWQLECEKIEQRCDYLLTSGQWSDCTFMVGSETNQTAVPAHKLVLAMASPVFEAMFYGTLSERSDPIVQIPDVQLDAFRALLQYIYTGNVDIDSFDMAWDLWYSAKKYMLPHLMKECKRYISSDLCPKNACRVYEFACLFDEKTLMDNCIKIISTNTKEVLNASSFVDVQLNTLVTVFSLDQLNVDSELDLFHAVTRYAEAKQRPGQISPEDGKLPSEDLAEKQFSPSVESSSQTSPAAKLEPKRPTEDVTAETIADKKYVKEEELTIRGALQNIRFLSMSAQQFAGGPAVSDLLTKEESYAVFMNILSKDRAVPMPTGFTECRGPRSDSKAECFKTGCLDHIIKELKCGIPLQVKQATKAAVRSLSETACIQQALDKGILDALAPALTDGDGECKRDAASAICNISIFGYPSQIRVLAEAATLQLFCRLLAARDGGVCHFVLCGLINIFVQLKEDNRLAVLPKLREFGVPQLLTTVQQKSEEQNRALANELLDYFSGGQK